MDGWIILVIAAVVILVIVGAYYSHKAAQQRIAELAQLAAMRGWQFDPEKDYSHDERYGHFSSFASGTNGYAYNTITGTVEIADAAWPMQMGDFHYQTTSTTTDSKGNTRTQTHHHYLSYLVVRTPFGETPTLFIRREGFFDKVAGMLGFDDIDFESAEFSRKFVVKSGDKRFAYDVVHPRMMEYLLGGEPPTIDLQRGECCFTDGERCWSVVEFEGRLAWAAEFFANWPRHVVGQLS
jgi:hypothetical protein